MSAASAVSTDRRSGSTLIVLLGVAALAVLALMVYLIWSGYQEAVRGARTTTRNYAAILEARLDATLRRADANLLELRGTVPVAALSKQAVPRYAREIDASLDFELARFNELAGLRIFDAAGDMLYTSDSASTPRTHIADRDYFRRLRDDPRADLVFSEAATSRATDRPSVAAARALRDGQGVFRGIVSAVIELDYFKELFQSLEIGPHGFISLVRSDDFRMVLRHPPLADWFNRALPEGTAMRDGIAAGNKQATLGFTSARTGVDGIASYRTLERYPFYVVAALGREDVLAGWRARTRAVGVAGLLLLLLLTGLLVRHRRAQARESRAIADLVESEERFRTLFEQAAVGVALTESGSDRTVRINKKYADFLGYGQAELLQKTYRSTTHPDDIPLGAAYRQRLDAGELSEFSHEKRYIRKDGAVVWGQVTVSPIWKADKTFDHYVAVVTDITERKRAEQALQQSEARYRRLTELSSDWYWEQDADFRYLETSVSVLKRLGLDHEERIGKTRWEVPSVGVSEAQWAAHRADLEARRTFRNFELGRINRHGLVVYGSTSGAPIFDAQGNFKGYGGVGTDITERKRMEESLRDSHDAYQDILATSRDGFLRLDTDGRVLDVNDTYLRQSGYSREELIGRRVSDLNHNGDEAVARNMRHVMETGSDQFESVHRRKDGSVWYVEVSTTYRDVRGGQFFAFLRDITERKRQEAELIAARQDAENASLAKTRFLAAASHDLRQPIQAINLFLDALNRTTLSETQKEISGYLAMAVRSLGELLSGLLDISKLDAGIVEPRLEMMDAENVLRRIEAEFAPMLREKKLHFRLSSRRDGLVLRTDPDLLLRILRNIVGNALKYTERGGILVGVRRRGFRGVIQVWDTGIGVAPAHISQIFEEYFQIGNPGRDKAKGLGLGLAIVRRLAKLIDGEVHCRSRLGRGTVFEISLPLAHGPSNSDNGPFPHRPGGADDASGFTGRRIVVIEDDALVAKAIEQSLGALGMTVTAFNDAEGALASMDIADADFYISDFRLPGRLDGVQLLNAIQQRSAGPISAVLLTGDTSPNRIDVSTSSSWNVLFKPVDLSKLLSMMIETTGNVRRRESQAHQP